MSVARVLSQDYRVKFTRLSSGSHRAPQTSIKNSMALPTPRDFEETLQAPPNTLRRQRVTVGTNLRGINLASWGATQYDVTIETKRRRERRQQPGAENVPPGEAPVAAPAMAYTVSSSSLPASLAAAAELVAIGAVAARRSRKALS